MIVRKCTRSIACRVLCLSPGLCDPFVVARGYVLFGSGLFSSFTPWRWPRLRVHTFPVLTFSLTHPLPPLLYF